MNRGTRLPAEVRAAVWRFAVIGLLTLGLVGGGTSWLMRRHVEELAVADAVRQSERVARGTVGPFVTGGVEALDASAIAALHRIVGPRLESASLRLSLRDGQGRVLYADDATLIGAVDALDALEREVLSTGASAVVPVPSGVRGRSDGSAPPGRTVTVLSAASSANGTPLLVQIQHPVEGLSTVAATLFRQLFPLFWLALGVLLLTQLPSAVLLARRVDAGQRARRELLARLVEASELERRRLARDLHDTVIQDLTGLAYALETLQPGGRQDHDMEVLRRARPILHRSVQTLRTMLTSLHPFDPDELSIAEALDRVADDLRHQGIDVELAIGADDAAALDRERAIVVYRIVREALSNVAKHAAADRAHVRVSVRDGEARVEVHDDGRGINPMATSPAEHFGLALLQEAARSQGGTAEVTSRPGIGTSVVSRIPVSSDRRRGLPPP